MFFIFGIFDFWAFLGSVFAFFVCIVVFFFCKFVVVLWSSWFCCLWLFRGRRGFVVFGGFFVVVAVLWSIKEDRR